MKPFEFVRVAELREALDLLAEHGTDARPIAGGQSLIPLLRRRELAPRYLVDISRLPELAGAEGNGAVTLGPLRTYAQLAAADPGGPEGLLAHCVRGITDLQIRNLATLGGAVCFAAPQYDMPPAVTTLDASFIVTGKDAGRTVACEDFFAAAGRTAVRPDELLTAITIPALPAGARWAVEKFHPHQGQYALAWVGCVLATDDDGVCTSARVVAGCASEIPVVVGEARQALVGRTLDRETIGEAARLVAANVETFPDAVWASAAYKTDLLEGLTARALGALAEAGDAP